MSKPQRLPLASLYPRFGWSALTPTLTVPALLILSYVGLPVIDALAGLNFTPEEVHASDAAPLEPPALGVPSFPQPLRATARAAPARTTALVRNFMVPLLRSGWMGPAGCRRSRGAPGSDAERARGAWSVGEDLGQEVLRPVGRRCGEELLGLG